MYAFTNRFSGPSLRQRIGMMNSQRARTRVWWRYGSWAMLVGLMVLACRHRSMDSDSAFRSRLHPRFPMTNATRTLAAELEKQDMPWFRQTSLLSDDQIIINDRQGRKISIRRYPEILCLKNNQLALKLPSKQEVRLFINGQSSSTKALSALRFEQVDDLFVYQKWDDAPGADKFPESYRVFISTTHKTPEINPVRISWKQFLLANAVSNYPLGKSSTFSMNKLLEATFFSNKLAFVQQTKDNHLKLYDEYTADIELYINGLQADSKQIESVHVREVDRLYTRERSFEEWADGPDRKHRFVLYIQTEPKRAKRDSSYYVFSPFYSGDF